MYCFLSFFQGWQSRRVVCTDSKLYFALHDEDLVRDHIPLEEILSIDIMHEEKDLEVLLSTFGVDRPGRASVGAISNKGRRRSSTKNRRGSAIANYISNALPRGSTHKDEDNSGNRTSAFYKAFQIHTVPGGFNSGRTYYLQAHSNQECETIVEKLNEYAAAARAKTHSASRAKLMQDRLRAVHDSRAFQSLSALVIITVASPSSNPCHAPYHHVPDMRATPATR